MSKSASELPNSQIMPEPSLEKQTRRQFTRDYKLRIITEADACKHGELGAMLRREKLYSNQLADWRREYAAPEKSLQPDHPLRSCGSATSPYRGVPAPVCGF